MCKMDYLDLNSHLEFVPLAFPIKNRIFICGSGGKSALAGSIAMTYAHTHIDLDACKFLANWEERKIYDFRKFTSGQIANAENHWVVEGNYTEKLGDLILKDSELIIWLDLYWQLTFLRIFTRSIPRCIKKQMICGRNYESWRQFFIKDALWWFYIVKRSKIPEGHKEFFALVSSHTPIIRIRNSGELNSFYKIHRMQLIKENI